MAIEKIEIIKKPKSIKEIIAFFSRKSMYKVMKTTLSFILKGRKVNFKLNIGGSSYTDGEIVTVGLPEQLFAVSYEEMYIAILALLGHEGQHVLSSNFNSFIRYNKEETERLVKKGMSKRFAQNFIHSIGNIIEDGRIENILVNRLPGYTSKIQFLNMYFWNLDKMDEETPELHGFISTILTLSVSGIYPKNYNKVFKGTKLDKEIEKIKGLIFKGTKARTCNDGLNICRKIIYTIEPYLFELYEEIRKEEELMEKFMKFLENLQDDFNNSEETDLNEIQGQSSHLQMPQPKKEYNNKNEGKDGEEDDNKNEGKNNKEEDDNNKKENANSNKKEQNKENDNDEEELELSSGANPDSEIDEDDTDALAESLINEKIKEISEELNDEIKEKFNEVEKEEKRKQEQIKNENNYELTYEEREELKRKYQGLVFREKPNNFPLKYSLPTEIKTPAKTFRKEIEKIFRDKNKIDIHGQNKGILNSNDLYKIGLGDYNIFTVEGNKSYGDYVVYILRDGSGSMYGEKEIASAYALSIIEEGLRNIVPFKTVTFNAVSGVTHYIIRNWKDKSKKNYAYNFLKYREAGGFNEDGYSIRVATKELLKRPERNKILIVLSDGLPQSIEDTKDAIKEARKKRIHLVGIMFGSEEFRKRNFKQYKEMYQKNIIATTPKGIPNKLTKALQQILKR